MTFPLRSANGGAAGHRWHQAQCRLHAVNWARLAEQVTSHRAGLGYSIAQLAAVSGLSTSTVDSIEHARKTSYDPATLSALERALTWTPGSVERVLRGLEPQPLRDPDLDAVISAWPRLTPKARRIMRILSIELARPE